jgi:MoaA/NifB/PqqE/SkfB family radical SAM enzyme
MKFRMLTSLFSHYIKSNMELRFAVIHVTTRCNARCVDRCSIWAQKPMDMPLEDLVFAVDVLAKNNFSVVYFTGGETGLYPYIIEGIDYAKKRGLVTSITTNGTLPKETLMQLRSSLDALSVSVDHYDAQVWDGAKHLPGVAAKAQETIRLAKAYGVKLYAITFLNPQWSTAEVSKVIHYVNDTLGIPLSISYPYVSANDGTFTVGGNLSQSNDLERNIKNKVAKVLEMKLSGAKIVNSTGYLRDILRAHDGAAMKYPCRAGRAILTVDCNLNVYPCYRRGRLFNLREYQNLNVAAPDTMGCDNKYCLINCFKESSQTARETQLKAAVEELTSSPRFYLGLIR